MGATLTHAQMRQILREGGTISHQGRHILHENDLPSLGELTSTSPEARLAAREDLEHRRLLLEQELRRLDLVPVEGEVPDIYKENGIDVEMLGKNPAIVPSEFGQKEVKPEDVPFTETGTEVPSEAKAAKPKNDLP